MASNKEETEALANKRMIQPVSLSTRRLKSFPNTPDLEVLVGPSQRVYRYHSLIMASYSTYVDTLLSSPLTNQETTTKPRSISFPEIKEETWEKMMAYLEPGGFQLGKPSCLLSDLEEVLPYYDKYQFCDGLEMCNKAIAAFFSSQNGGYSLTDPKPLASIAVMVCCELNLMSRSAKEAVVKWAADALKKMVCRDEETIQKLLPLVENDDQVLISLVKITKGRHYTDMTIDEMRKLTKEESFASEVLLKVKQIYEIREILERVSIENLSIDSEREAVRGPYERDLYTRTWPDHGFKHQGCLQYSYKKEQDLYPDPDDPPQDVTIDAMDPFGLTWEISTFPPTSPRDDDNDNEGGGDDNERDERSRDQEDNTQRIVLYRWDCGYSSLFPPKFGWDMVEAESQIKLSYAFSKPYF